MTVLLIIFFFFIGYVLVGFTLTRLFLPQMIRLTTYEYELETSAPLSDHYKSKVREDVKIRSLCMLFGWPIYLPMTLAYRTAHNQIQVHDPDALRRLEREVQRLELKQLEQAKKQDDED